MLFTSTPRLISPPSLFQLLSSCLPRPWETLLPTPADSPVLLPLASLTAQQYAASCSYFLVVFPHKQCALPTSTQNLSLSVTSSPIMPLNIFCSHISLGYFQKTSKYVIRNLQSFSVSTSEKLFLSYFYLSFFFFFGGVGGSQVWPVYPLFSLVLIIFGGF